MLRPIQLRTIMGIRAAYARGARRILIVAPTGYGKTVVLAHIVASHVARGGKVVIVVHRRELVGQTVSKLHAAGVGHVGVIAAGETADPNALVQVCMVQTMLARDAYPFATMLIIDEAHHFVAEEWSQVAAHYTDVLTLGFTATPMRADGTPLGDIFEEIFVAASIKELIGLNFLVPCDVVAPPKKTRSNCAEVIASYAKHGGNRPAVIFAAGVQDARDLAAEFAAAGISAACVDGETDDDLRDQTIARFATGDLQILTNVYCLVEGWDAPRAEVMILARGCGHVGTYLQMIGRILRPAPGKDRALLIDLRGAVHTHGMPEDDRVFSLEGKAISEGDAPVRTCPECEHVCALACRVCPSCDYEFPAPDYGDESAELVKITKAEVERGYFVSALDEANRRGYKPGYAAHRFQEKFGRFPAKFWRELVSRRAA